MDHQTISLRAHQTERGLRHVERTRQVAIDHLGDAVGRQPLPREGMSIVLTGRRRGPLEQVAERIVKRGGKALVKPAGVGDADAGSPSARRFAVRAVGSTFSSTAPA
jgi:hypothetical protein